MIAHRTSRGSAVLIALGVQALILLALGVGFGIVRVPQPDAPALSVALLREIQPPFVAPSLPEAHVQARVPEVPPVVPVDIQLPAAAVPPPTAAATGTPIAAGGSGSRMGIVRRVEPDYPQAAVARRAQGSTSVAFLVDANGHPGAVRVLRSSGDAALDEAAVRAVQKWEFTAATANEKVVPTWGRLEVNFNLSEYRSQHPGLRADGSREPDQVALLTAIVRSWTQGTGTRVMELRERRNLELLSPTLRALLARSGAVRSIRYVGVSARPPEDAGDADAQQLRALAADAGSTWQVFEVTQERGSAQWYCAEDAAAQIRYILVSTPRT